MTSNSFAASLDESLAFVKSGECLRCARSASLSRGDRHEMESGSGRVRELADPRGDLLRRSADHRGADRGVALVPACSPVRTAIVVPEEPTRPAFVRQLREPPMITGGTCWGGLIHEDQAACEFVCPTARSTVQAVDETRPAEVAQREPVPITRRQDAGFDEPVEVLGADPSTVRELITRQRWSAHDTTYRRKIMSRVRRSLGGPPMGAKSPPEATSSRDAGRSARSSSSACMAIHSAARAMSPR